MGGVAEEGAEDSLRSAWAALGGDSVTADDLIARHREPHRRYHTVAHVVWVLRAVEDLLETESVTDADAVRVAALFHDAVYDPLSADNERHSAALAARTVTEVLGWPSERAARTSRLVLATMAHHPADDDQAVLLDADLSILGADAAAYLRYVAAVRAEYAHVDEAAWRAGRSAVLRGFLERERIYTTATMRDRAERQARANLTGELVSLSAPG